METKKLSKWKNIRNLMLVINIIKRKNKKYSKVIARKEKVHDSNENEKIKQISIINSNKIYIFVKY